MNGRHLIVDVVLFDCNDVERYARAIAAKIEELDGNGCGVEVDSVKIVQEDSTR